MRILCPIDFSKVSINAIEWACDFLSSFEHEEEKYIEIVHCIFYRRRLSIFANIDDILFEKATEDMAVVLNRLRKHEGIKFKTRIVLDNPKDYIPFLQTQENYDFIVNGSVGLTSLSGTLIGSVSYHIANNTTIPLFIIPSRVKFKPFMNIVLGVESENCAEVSKLTPLIDIVKAFNSKLFFVHVRDGLSKEDFMQEQFFERFFSEIKSEYHCIQIENSVNESLEVFSDFSESDLLALIHHESSWLDHLFTKTKMEKQQEMIERPILIL